MSELKKYIIPTFNVEDAIEINNELKSAGFDGLSESFIQAHGDGLIISINVGGLQSTGWSDYISVTYVSATVLHPSDILNGGAMKLDGAKKVEPRWFLYAEDYLVDVLECDNGKSTWLGVSDGKVEKSWNTLWVAQEGEEFKEITKADLDDYILKYAEKAKELGMVLRKPVIGEDEVICLANGCVETAHEAYDYSEGVAGYRYCRKVEAVQEELIQPEKYVQSYCGWCGHLLDQKGRNFCGDCGSEL